MAAIGLFSGRFSLGLRLVAAHGNVALRLAWLVARALRLARLAGLIVAGGLGPVIAGRRCRYRLILAGRGRLDFLMRFWT